MPHADTWLSMFFPQVPCRARGEFWRGDAPRTLARANLAGNHANGGYSVSCLVDIVSGERSQQKRQNQPGYDCGFCSASFFFDRERT